MGVEIAANRLVLRCFIYWPTIADGAARMLPLDLRQLVQGEAILRSPTRPAPC